MAEWRDIKDITLTLNDEPRFTFKINLSTCEIITTIVTLEYLWASAYTHLILFIEYTEAIKCGSKHFDIGDNSKRRAAHDLLNWATSNLTRTDVSSWPNHMPQPVRYPKETSEIYPVNELFFCMVAWIIHHEIAHIRLNHQPLVSTNSIVEEKEADIAATKWILGNSINQQKSSKQTIGIAAAILALQEIQEPFRFSSFQTHPKAFERIEYCLAEASVAENDNVYAFAATIMQIQLSYRGIEITPDWTTYKELFSEHLIEFARN